MQYTEKIVDLASLQRDVLCYWQMVGNVDHLSGITSRYVPKGQSLLVFNYGDPIDYHDAPKIELVNAQLIIVPAVATSSIVNQKGAIDLFGISLIGDGLFKLIQQPITTWANGLPDALKQKFEALYEELDGLAFSSKSTKAERFLLDNLNQQLNSIPFQTAIELINAAKGAVNISEIAEKVHVSERQLQRLFKARIGISPKDYCKTIRVNSYLDFVISKGDYVDWMDLVVAHNYHDQPHFINEVKSISKLSPRRLQRYRDTLYHRYIGS